MPWNQVKPIVNIYPCKSSVISVLQSPWCHTPNKPVQKFSAKTIILNSFTGSLCLITLRSRSLFLLWRLALSFTALPPTPAASTACSVLRCWCWCCCQWESPHHHLQDPAPRHLPYGAATNTTLLDPSTIISTKWFHVYFNVMVLQVHWLSPANFIFYLTQFSI